MDPAGVELMAPADEAPVGGPELGPLSFGESEVEAVVGLGLGEAFGPVEGVPAEVGVEGDRVDAELEQVADPSLGRFGADLAAEDEPSDSGDRLGGPEVGGEKLPVLVGPCFEGVEGPGGDR